jgi:hypothetical protein
MKSIGFRLPVLIAWLQKVLISIGGTRWYQVRQIRSIKVTAFDHELKDEEEYIQHMVPLD